MKLLFAILFFALPAAAQTELTYPRLFFKYSWLFENIYSPLGPPPEV
jgi:hypothetical protein